MVPEKIPYKQFVGIYKQVPRFTIDLVVKTEKGILLTKRKIKPWEGKWHIPGGTIFFREKIKEAIDRIAKEELNLKLKVIKNVGVIEYFNEKPGYSHSISSVFLTEIKSGIPKINYQASKLNFFNNVPENTILEQKRFLKDNNFLFDSKL